VIRGASFVLIVVGSAWLLGGGAGIAGVGRAGQLHEEQKVAAIERATAAADARVEALGKEKEAIVERLQARIDDAKERVVSKTEALQETTATLDEKIAAKQTERDEASDDKAAKRADAAIAFLTKLRDEKVKKPQAMVAAAEENVRDAEQALATAIAAADQKIVDAQRGKTDAVAAIEATAAKDAPQASFVKPGVAVGLGGILAAIGAALALSAPPVRRRRPAYASSSAKVPRAPPDPLLFDDDRGTDPGESAVV
jgi:hypothetical protein